MKSLNDVKKDMSVLYDEVKGGKTDMKTAAELANIAGKYLKAEALALARDIWIAQQKNTSALARVAKQGHTRTHLLEG